MNRDKHLYEYRYSSAHYAFVYSKANSKWIDEMTVIPPSGTSKVKSENQPLDSVCPASIIDVQVWFLTGWPGNRTRPVVAFIVSDHSYKSATRSKATTRCLITVARMDLSKSPHSHHTWPSDWGQCHNATHDSSIYMWLFTHAGSSLSWLKCSAREGLRRSDVSWQHPVNSLFIEFCSRSCCVGQACLGICMSSLDKRRTWSSQNQESWKFLGYFCSWHAKASGRPQERKLSRRRTLSRAIRANGMTGA